MKLPRYRGVLLLAAILGVSMPAYVFIRAALDWRFGIDRFEALFWPSAIMLGATIGIERTPTAYLIVAVSVATNILLYALILSIIWGICVLLRCIIRRATRVV
jgi:hypothetical protein